MIIKTMSKTPPHIPAKVEEVLKLAEAKLGEGATVWFKWNCQHCLTRQSFDEENTFFTHGKCEQCEGITNLLEYEDAQVGIMLHQPLALGGSVIAFSPGSSIDDIFAILAGKK